jgi:hypothetical protein
MPTKTYKRVSDQKTRPFCPSETELFPMKICGQMVQVLGITDPDEIARLHRILNYAGSFAHLAAYVKKEGVSAGSQRTALNGLKRLLEELIEFIDELDWQSNEDIAAGYAKDAPVFTASADRINSEAYSQRDRAFAAIRSLATAVESAKTHLNTSGKSRLGIEIRQAKYIIEAYEEFAGQRVSGERSKKSGNLVRQFLELGVKHITEGALTTQQIDYVLRKAAEIVHQRGK